MATLYPTLETDGLVPSASSKPSSPRRVEAKFERLMDKLGVFNTRELVAKYVRYGGTPTRDWPASRVRVQDAYDRTVRIRMRSGIVEVLDLQAHAAAATLRCRSDR